jgi:hypothetical protein
VSIAFNPDTTASSIAAVSISGVTVCNVSNVPQSARMITPILVPQPDGWLSDVAQGPKAVSVADAGQSDFSYTLHYVFLLCEAGSGVEQTDPYNNLVSKLKTVLQTVLDDDTLAESIEISLNGMDGIGVVQDPSGVDFWGALISLRCLEYAA